MNIKKHSEPQSRLSLWFLAMVLSPFSLYFVDNSASQGVKALAIAAVAAVMVFFWCMAERRIKMQMIGVNDADFLKIMEEANASALEHDREQRRKRDEALAYVATIVGVRKLKHIEGFIANCDYTSEFEIVDSHGGHRQDEKGTAFRYIYLDQYSNGGMSGDDFAGWVWIPLPKGKFLKFHYC